MHKLVIITLDNKFVKCIPDNEYDTLISQFNLKTKDSAIINMNGKKYIIEKINIS